MANPLMVTHATSRGDEVKFGFTQANTGEQGIIACTVQADGNLT